MPRVYKKKLGVHGKCNYNQEYVQRAVANVRNGNLSIRQAAERYGVPYSTVQRRVQGTHSLKYGRQPVLSEEEESHIVEASMICAQWGFPLRSTDIKIIVQQYLNAQGRTTRFTDNRPGDDWFKCFLRRNPTLTIKLAENTKRARAGLSYEVIEEYFQNLKKTLQDVPPENIINYDETNFGDDPGAVKVVTKRGSKHTFRTIDTSKSCTTVMFAIAGDGTLLPPYVVYKAKHMYEGWTENGLEGTRYNRSLSGWFDSDLFEDWFNKIALPYFKKLTGPKMLLGDNLNSHLTLGVIKKCEENNIRFTLLPPNATHLLQPLDVAYFRPMKRAWKKNLEEWKKKNRGVLPKTLFPQQVKKTIELIGIRSAENCRAGFEACGVIPFNPNRVLQKIPRNVQPDGTQEQAWSQAIIDHLEQFKTDSGGKSLQKKGKKVNISPGKSIAAADLIINSLTDVEPKKSSKKRKKIEHISCSEDEQEIADLDENQEVSEGEEENPERSGSYEGNPEPSGSSPFGENTEPSRSSPVITNIEELKVGDFILAKFPTAKRERHFLGKVESLGDEITINCLRKKGLEKGYFVYPNIPDLSVITKTQFSRKVSLKLVKRGKYVFNLDPDEFQKLE